MVDTLTRNFVGGSLNSDQDMGRFVDGCEAIRRQLSAAVLVIMHSRKDKPDVELGIEVLRNSSLCDVAGEQAETIR